MNIFKQKRIKIFANISSCLMLFFVLISFYPSVSLAQWGTGYLNVGESSPNGLWTRMKEFVSPYNNGLNTYNANTYGGSSYGGGSSYSGGAPKTFADLIMNTIIGGMLTPVVALIVSAAIVVFLWGVFKFIKSEGKEKDAGRDMMVWGIVGIFVMMSMWGLVNILRGTFNLNDTQIDVSGVLLK